MRIKKTEKLDLISGTYRSSLSSVINMIAIAPKFIKKKMIIAIGEMYDAVYPIASDPKSISTLSNDKLDSLLSEILIRLNDRILQYIMEVMEGGIYPISDYVTDNETDDKGENIIAFTDEDIDGMDLYDRINRHTNNFKLEAEAFIVAGIANKLSKNQVVDEWIKNANKPYSSELIKEAIKSNEYEATNLKAKGFSYGNGVQKSSLMGLTLVVQDSLFRFYNKTLNDSWLTDGNILGWISIRNSSFPCQLCDSESYIFHPITETFVSWHRRCVCLCVPIYKDMI